MRCFVLFVSSTGGFNIKREKRNGGYVWVRLVVLVVLLLLCVHKGVSVHD